MAFNPIQRGGFTALTQTTPVRPAPRPPKGVEGPGFEARRETVIGQAGGAMGGATDALTSLASGDNVDLHGSMIALEKADIALRMTVSARDKFISAYEQIMNMSL